MRSIYLGLAIHNHQPVDNFPEVFEKAYHDAYTPFIEALKNHPRIRLSLHYSGCLLDWLLENKRDFIKRIAELANRGQVEIMTGGYYEPILPIIPDDDKLGQIAKLTSAVRREFNYSPAGIWLAERVWEPQLPKPLHQAGVEWTIVDDNHFHAVGLNPDQLLGYYVTEEEGCPVKVFASSKDLRYSIPWHRAEEVIEYIKSLATEDGRRVVVMGDDGEKFGLWPGTFKHCWEDGWVENFFTALEENSSWLKTIPLGDYAQSNEPLGSVYLPTASYGEMQEWSMPAASSHEFHLMVKQLEQDNRHDITKYMHAGFWRCFLAKYPEINHMHKKMLRIHGKVHRAIEETASDSALNELWKGQCNCPYWHGVFGGVYLYHIRQGVYRHLIAAENAADAILKKSQPWLEWHALDFDGDTTDELLIEGETQNLYLDPGEGGVIVEWDLRHPEHNLGAVMTRRQEAYHLDITEAIRRSKPDENEVKTIHEIFKVKQDNIDQYLHYDKHQRHSLVDHIFALGTTIEDYVNSNYDEIGDFSGKPYSYAVDAVADGLTLHLKRDGHISASEKRLPFRVEKDVAVKISEEGMKVRYVLTNTSDTPIEGVFASEWNLSLTEESHNEHCYYDTSKPIQERLKLKTTQDVADVKGISFNDPENGFALSLKMSEPARLWRLPIQAVTNSEDGFEVTYQGNCIILGWAIKLNPHEVWETTLGWKGLAAG
jgi:hypothetical protein